MTKEIGERPAQRLKSLDNQPDYSASTWPGKELTKLMILCNYSK